MTQIRTLALLCAVLAISACNTIQGAGEDLQTAGATVSHEARKAESGM